MPAHLQVASPGPNLAVATTGEIRVVLADNHVAMRRTLRLLLDGEADIVVLAEAGDLSAVRRDLRDRRPDVLVLDLGMHNGSSLDVIHHLHEQIGAPRIVVLTMQDSPAFARRAIKAGAIGFVLKDQADTELPTAVREAARGRGYISASVRDDLEPPCQRAATAVA